MTIAHDRQLQKIGMQPLHGNIITCEEALYFVIPCFFTKAMASLAFALVAASLLFWEDFSIIFFLGI